MGKTLVIAEKPSAGADMAKVLGCTEKKNGYLESENYIVTWAVGHLVGLKEPQEHDEAFREWRIEDLPLFFDLSDSLKVLPDTASQFKTIKDLIARDDVDSLINAGDAGREGYLIQSWIYRLAGNRKPVKVLWASSLTEEALKKAFADLKDDREFFALLQEAEARAEGDYLLGMNYSRLLTLTRAGSGLSLSYGRCQTPLLNLIVTRDLEIEGFQKEPFYNVEASYSKGFKGILVDKTDKGYARKDLKDRNAAEQIAGSVSGIKGKVLSYQSEKKSRKAPLLYNLAALQKTMGSKYGYTAEETLALAQTLYEKHKILSYPRTDSQYLSMDLFHEIGKHLESCAFGSYQDYVARIDVSSISADKRYFNDHKVTDHHALLPTINPDMGEIYKLLSEKERNVFDAVVTSFIAIFYPDYEFNATELVIQAGDSLFLSKGTTVLKLGFKEILKMEPGETEDGKENNDEKQILPALNEGDEISIDKISILDKMTQPPKAYSVSSLISAMEKYNIGTSATRAEIIKKLQNPKREFITLEKGKYHSTQLGRKYIAVVPDELKDPMLTDSFEKDLSGINSGNLDKEEFLNKWVERLKSDIERFSSETAPKIVQEKDEIGSCPMCKTGMVVKTQVGYGCSDYKNGCKFTIWGKNVKEKDVKQLLDTGKTGLIKGFTSKAGKPYNAILKLEDDGSVTKIFENSVENAKGICPKCKKGRMIPSPKALSCEDKEGCGFILWKTMFGRTLTEAQLTQLLEKGKTGNITGFVSKAGKTFEGSLILKEDFSVGIEFKNKK